MVNPPWRRAVPRPRGLRFCACGTSKYLVDLHKRPATRGRQNRRGASAARRRIPSATSGPMPATSRPRVSNPQASAITVALTGGGADLGVALRLKPRAAGLRLDGVQPGGWYDGGSLGKLLGPSCFRRGFFCQRGREAVGDGHRNHQVGR